jgi:hypothetical protein
LSHTSTIETKLTDRDALIAACTRIGATFSEGEAKLFDRTKASGYIVKLPGWRYPVIIDKETGEAKYDNYGGSWGKPEVLNSLKQEYATAVTKRQLARQGFRVHEQRVDGKVVLKATR